MNKNMIKKTGLFLFFSTFLISGCDSDEPIQRLVDQRAALASGVNFDTAKLVVLNPDTGQEVPSCIQIGSSKQDYQSINRKIITEPSNMENAMQKCKTELNFNDANLALKSALELSRKPIEGEIKRNGEVIPARFIVTVTTLYHGSHCNVTSSGGNQSENCGRHR